MSTNFYFKSLSFNSYRGLKKLSLEKLRRINIIGGCNGTGKSTLLEGIFLILDRRGPIAIARPFQWRNVPLSNLHGLTQLFSGSDRSKTIGIESTTQDGNIKLSLKLGPIPTGLTVTLASGAVERQPSAQQTGNGGIGLNLETTVNSAPDDASFVIPVPEGMNVNMYRPGKAGIPPAVLMTAKTRNDPPSDAVRLTTIIREGKLPDLLRIAAVVRPELKSIQLLQDGPVALMHAQLEDGQLLPLSMLGDGLHTVVSIALTIMTLRGGVLLLDEFDSAIHYSVMKDVWSIIGDLANTYNCQIFAATHSRECIAAAAEGLSEASGLDDLQYIRLETYNDTNQAVMYTGSELIESLNADWEVR